MSTATIDNAKLTVQQRSQQNAEEIAAYLGLDDLKLVNAAVLEAALDIIHQNNDFAQRVKSTFQHLQQDQSKVRRATPKKGTSIHSSTLVPIGSVDHHYIDPNAPPDPFFLLKLYGPHQLPQTLNEYSAPMLKKSVANLKSQFPNDKPKTKATKGDLIDFMVGLVTKAD